MKKLNFVKKEIVYNFGVLRTLLIRFTPLFFVYLFLLLVLAFFVWDIFFNKNDILIKNVESIEIIKHVDTVYVIRIDTLYFNEIKEGGKEIVKFENEIKELKKEIKELKIKVNFHAEMIDDFLLN